MNAVPEARLRRLNDAQTLDGDYVLYWMTAHRRLEHNFALQYAVERARVLGKPLLIFEALRSGYRWASDRFHRFILQGMKAHRQALDGTSVRYYAYVEPETGHGSGLLAALSSRAAEVIADDHPGFFQPRMLAAAAKVVPCTLWAVDANGILPLNASPRIFTTAYSFRRHVQKCLLEHLAAFPSAEPLAEAPALRAELPSDVTSRWPEASDSILSGSPSALASLPIDHSVGAAPVDGGRPAAAARLKAFLGMPSLRYADDRNHPDIDPSSGLSPYLHFGHLGAHEVVSSLLEREQWTPAKTGVANGKRSGWWGLSPSAEAYLDQVITWREIGHVFAHHAGPTTDTFGALPDWARKTLNDHREDRRPYLYDLQTLASGNTHDPLWNAAQNQLREHGRMPNYLRMLWGKNVLQWTESPEQAYAFLLDLNNRYAVDGRDPNSSSGIAWVLGRFDRAWGPERPIFGKVRYMTSDSTRRKLKMSQWLERWSSRSA